MSTAAEINARHQMHKARLQVITDKLQRSVLAPLMDTAFLGPLSPVPASSNLGKIWMRSYKNRLPRIFFDGAIQTRIERDELVMRHIPSKDLYRLKGEGLWQYEAL